MIMISMESDKEELWRKAAALTKAQKEAKKFCARRSRRPKG
jgi:hypothetical protein